MTPPILALAHRLTSPEYGEDGITPICASCREFSVNWVCRSCEEIVLEQLARAVLGMWQASEPMLSVLDGFAALVESESLRRKQQSAGGQQVPNHGDLCSAPVSTMVKLEWWAREMRAAIDAYRKANP